MSLKRKRNMAKHIRADRPLLVVAISAKKRTSKDLFETRKNAKRTPKGVKRSIRKGQARISLGGAGRPCPACGGTGRI